MTVLQRGGLALVLAAAIRSFVPEPFQFGAAIVTGMLCSLVDLWVSERLRVR